MAEQFDTGLHGLRGELRRLGPYRLLGQLGSGGMGMVYLGRDPATGQLAALKTLLAPGGVSVEARKRFARETRLARRVTSKYTAKILDADTEAERPWMAMEYVPAPSLEALVVQGGALSDERALRWIGGGVVRALRELHGIRIVHRDVKPLNILLTAGGPKVIDFGISHAADLTSTTLTFGTVAFAAPEQANGEASTSASDIYALGITLAYMARGKLPYPETQEPLQQLNYVRQAATELDGLPPGLTPLIRDCLQMDPGARPTADQLIRRLGAQDSQGLPPGWSALIARHAEEGRRLQRAADQSEAETITRDWTGDGPGSTRAQTGSPPGPGHGPGPGPGPGPGARPDGARSDGRSAKVAGAVVAAVVLMVGAVALAASLSDDAPSAGSTTSDTTPSAATSSDAAPIEDDTPYDADPPPSSETEDDEDDEEPEPVDTPDPTTEAPEPDPTTSEPEKVYYGAIAVATNGNYGRAWDYGSRETAREKAMSQCSGPGCKIVADFDKCGALAYNRAQDHYWGAYGEDRAEAERKALNDSGGGTILTSVCNNTP